MKKKLTKEPEKKKMQHDPVEKPAHNNPPQEEPNAPPVVDVPPSEPLPTPEEPPEEEVKKTLIAPDLTQPHKLAYTTAEQTVGEPPHRDEAGNWVATFPYSLPNGDLVIDQTLPDKAAVANEASPVNQVQARHLTMIIKKADETQVYPFLMQCSCGTQARVYTEEGCRRAAEGHVESKLMAVS